MTDKLPPASPLLSSSKIKPCQFSSVQLRRSLCALSVGDSQRHLAVLDRVSDWRLAAVCGHCYMLQTEGPPTLNSCQSNIHYDVFMTSVCFVKLLVVSPVGKESFALTAATVAGAATVLSYHSWFICLLPSFSVASSHDRSVTIIMRVVRLLCFNRAGVTGLRTFGGPDGQQLQQSVLETLYTVL